MSGVETENNAVVCLGSGGINGTFSRKIFLLIPAVLGGNSSAWDRYQPLTTSLLSRWGRQEQTEGQPWPGAPKSPPQRAVPGCQQHLSWVLVWGTAQGNPCPPHRMGLRGGGARAFPGGRFS